MCRCMVVVFALTTVSCTAAGVAAGGQCLGFAAEYDEVTTYSVNGKRFNSIAYVTVSDGVIARTPSGAKAFFHCAPGDQATNKLSSCAMPCCPGGPMVEYGPFGSRLLSAGKCTFGSTVITVESIDTVAK